MLTNKQLEEVKTLAQPLIDYIRKETDWIPDIAINNTEIKIKAIDIKREEVLTEAGYRTSLKELEEKADLVISLLSKIPNKDLSYKWEIVKLFLTKDEMINIIQHNLTNDDGFYGCPSEYDELRNITNTTGYCDTSCINCWKQIFNIKEIKFKGED